MIGNEIKKIWNIRTAVFLFILGGTFFYDWILGQMNLEHLPLFENVDVTLGTDLIKRFGNSVDSAEMEQVAMLNEAAKRDFDQNVKAAYPQLNEMGFKSFEELERCLSEADLEKMESQEYKAMHELYGQIVQEFELELESINYYSSMIGKRETQAGAARSYGAGGMKANAVNRIENITKWSELSVLPDSVNMNMSYVIQGFCRITMYLVLILVLPYVAFDNKSNVYPVVASTKHGRNIIKTQLWSMLVGMLPLLAVCDIALYAAYTLYTPYAVFNHCMVEYLWFDLSQIQYFWIQVIVCNLIVISLALLFFFASSFCRTIVGTIVMAIPCWGLGEAIILFCVDNMLSCSLLTDSVMVCFKYGIVIIIAALFMVGIFCINRLIRYRLHADIL